MNIKDLVKNNKVRFLFYRKGELWYEIWQINTITNEWWQPLLTFPVPIEDTGDGQFNREDKAMLFMRYIRKHLDDLKE